MFRRIISFLSFPASMALAGQPVKTDLQSYFLADAAYFNRILDFNGLPVESEPYTRFIGGLNFYTWPTENFMIQVNPELLSSTQLPQQPGRADGVNEPKVGYVAYVEEGKGVWTYGDMEHPKWRVALGWQYYKDNPDGRIFGDYLFRSMIYPSLVFTGFHKAKTQVFGLRVENNLGNMFGHNFFVTSETQRYPFYDISLAYSAGVKLGNMFELGASVNWVSAIPVRPSRTTPKGGEYFEVGSNIYRQVEFQEGTVIRLPNGDTLQVVSVRSVTDTAGKQFGEIVIWDSTGVRTDSTRTELFNGKVGGIKDGAFISEGGFNNPDMAMLCVDDNCDLGLFPELNGKNVQYTFSGQIVTLRASLNPLAGMGLENMLGKDAFKLYAEAAILGVRNYDGFYKNMRERIPIMVGVNLPTFNFLDFLAAEVEYFPSKLPPSWRQRWMFAVPHPGGGPSEFNKPYLDPDRQKKDDVKWGLIARKTFKGFALAAQGGTDHMHSSTINENFHEIMSKPSHWYLMMRLILWTGL